MQAVALGYPYVSSKVKINWHRYGMVIRPFDRYLSFEISSQEEPDVWYKVQLDDFWQNGQCNCPDFTFRRAPYLVRGEHDKGDSCDDIDKYRCKHLRVVREILCDYLIRLLAKKEEAQPFEFSL
jgi:hypothetical protein